VHRSDVSKLLQDLADESQPRFGELLGTRATNRATATMGNENVEKSNIRDTLATLTPKEQSLYIEGILVPIVRELTGVSASTLTIDTPITEAGLDSLGATQFSAQLQEITGVAFSPSLISEHPTTRSIASHAIKLLNEKSQLSSEDEGMQRSGIRAQKDMYSEATHHLPGLPDAAFRIITPRERRQRVLFLHGQGTSAKLAHYLLKMRGWLELLPFDFVIPDGPHLVSAWDSDSAFQNLGLESLVKSGLYDPNEPQRMWGARFDKFTEQYLRRHPEVLAELEAKGTSVDQVVSGAIKEQGGDAEARWANTVRFVQSVNLTQGPFDGIAGFSEGAATVHNLLLLQAAGTDVGLASVRFCIAMSPWISPMIGEADRAKLDVPLLLTQGARDLDIFKDSAPVYASDFHDVTVFEHPNEHEYPTLSTELRHMCFELIEPRRVRSTITLGDDASDG